MSLEIDAARAVHQNAMKPRVSRTSLSLWRIAAATALLSVRVLAGEVSDIVELESVEGLRFLPDSANVVLTWPSDPRETFAVLWRSNANWQTPWTVLTNQLRAPHNASQTVFCDRGALGGTPGVETNTNFGNLYRVFVVPDFWFDMEGVALRGGPKNPGEDFLPFYYGNKASDFFKPQVDLVVEGQTDPGSPGEEDIQLVNCGTEKEPRWVYVAGFWFHHDWFANGRHTLQLRTLLTLNNFVGDWSWSVTLTNAPVQVCIENDISFVGFEPLIFGSNYTFVAQSATPRVNWRSEVRDYRGRFLASKLGRTTNGDIRWKWDLRDTRGRLHDSLETDPYFVPTLTTWPLDEEPRGSQRLLKLLQEGWQSTWWSQRLGRRFVRKEPSREERMKKFIYSETSPFEVQLHPRPWKCLVPPRTNTKSLQ